MHLKALLCYFESVKRCNDAQNYIMESITTYQKNALFCRSIPKRTLLILKTI